MRILVTACTKLLYMHLVILITFAQLFGLIGCTTKSEEEVDVSKKHYDMNLKSAEKVEVPVSELDNYGEYKTEFVIQSGHISGVEDITITSNGKYIITAGHDTLKLWEFNTGILLRTFVHPPSKSNRIISVSIDMKGMRVFAGTAAGESRAYLYQKDRYIYNDLVRRSGAIVFSSSRGGEFSYESDDYKNGLFTEEIINAFTKVVADKDRDNIISSGELREYVSSAVPKLTDNNQHPTVDRDNIYQNFGFPTVTSLSGQIQ